MSYFFVSQKFPVNKPTKEMKYIRYRPNVNPRHLPRQNGKIEPSTPGVTSSFTMKC